MTATDTATDTFREGETIYDVDGNAYTVRNGRAELNAAPDSLTYFLDHSMAACFTRTNPKP